MAQKEKLMIGYRGPRRLLQVVEKALKKFIAPGRYSIVEPGIDKTAFDAALNRFTHASRADQLRVGIPDGFTQEGILALTNLAGHTALPKEINLHCVIDLRLQRSIIMPMGFEAHALLIEARGLGTNDPFALNTLLATSTYTAPRPREYIGSDPRYDYAAAAVIKGVLDGWRPRSWEYHGILWHMNVPPE